MTDIATFRVYDFPGVHFNGPVTTTSGKELATEIIAALRSENAEWVHPLAKLD